MVSATTKRTNPGECILRQSSRGSIRDHGVGEIRYGCHDLDFIFGRRRLEPGTALFGWVNFP